MHIYVSITFLYSVLYWQYMIILWILLLILSLTILVKSADFFTSAAEKIGKAVGISEFVVGITIVSIGTSIPELATSILSVFRDSPGIVVGNALGSNIANVLLVLGIGSLMLTKQIKFKQGAEVFDLVVLVAATVAIFLIGLLGNIPRGTGIVLVTGYILYMVYLIWRKQDSKNAHGRFQWLQVWILLITGALIYFSADWAVVSVKTIAEALSVPPSIIAVSVVAVGTSLPELSVTIVALRKKQLELALGNIIGSNTFNILVVIGIPSIMVTIPFVPILRYLGGFVLLAATGLLVMISLRKHTSKPLGMAMCLAYVLFIILMFYLKNTAGAAY